MNSINKYANWTPYLYFIAIAIYWFTSVNRIEGLSAYPILLLAIPFVWQLVKPNRKLNFYLGLSFICLSSYMIVGVISDLLNIPPIVLAKGVIIYGGLFALLNFVMSAWIIRNSYKRTF
ncbi:MAG: hypothetical protein KJO49_07850 [Bacteroidia bacterium]|nr:hypothetical protein [Bacteroidia bacterium]MBT8269498.1 hypothetical protein [Bacteroidia bacterium]NNF83067.1 hypothetical protein [Flavobacteriaceae bacterium]NNK70707.1 hypothetical protein [Flavobacteriaceae bacterium]NNL79020.1 hypothetical protein [Flavobacteriaceae bacterium]